MFLFFKTMKCPYCNNDSKVIDSRESEDIIKRRRECLKCSKRFNTYERVESLTLNIIKKDKTREQFDREKLKRGIMKACEKRPVSSAEIEEVVSKVESKLRKLNTVEIPSKVLGEEVMKILKKIDNVAYIRFASVYREFEDVGDFKKEIQTLLKR